MSATDTSRTEEQQVTDIAGTLRDYATHFEERDWAYTRDLGDLAAIRYNDRYDRLLARARRSLGYLVRGAGIGGLPVNRWGMARYSLHRDRHLPDGILDGGAIITHWEETGEYLQFVQPTVGAMLAEWMTAEPGNPHAKKIAAEMQRIQDDYSARIAAAKDTTDGN